MNENLDEFSILSLLALGLSDELIEVATQKPMTEVSVTLEQLFKSLHVGPDRMFDRRCRVVNIAMRSELITLGNLAHWEFIISMEVDHNIELSRAVRIIEAMPEVQFIAALVCAGLNDEKIAEATGDTVEFVRTKLQQLYSILFGEDCPRFNPRCRLINILLRTTIMHGGTLDSMERICRELDDGIDGEPRNADRQCLIRFPTSPVGELCVVTDDTCEVLGLALGDVRVSSDVRLLLKLDLDSCEDLDWLGSIHRLDGLQLHYNSSLSEEQAFQLAGIPGLKRVRLSGAKLSDNALAAIATAPDLEVLLVDDSNITDEDLRWLGACKSLTKLSLSRCAITGRSFGFLPGRLTELDLSGTKITDASMQSIAILRELEILHLRDTSVTNAAIKSIIGLKQLSSLDVSRTAIAEGVGRLLSEMCSLRRLYADETSFADDDLDQISTLFDLEFLSLMSTSVTDAGAQSLKELQNLRYLCLDNTRIADGCLPQIGRLSCLETLDLCRTKITALHIDHLRKLKKLKNLAVLKTKVKRDEIETLRAHLPDIEEIYI